MKGMKGCSQSQRVKPSQDGLTDFIFFCLSKDVLSCSVVKPNQDGQILNFFLSE